MSFCPLGFKNIYLKIIPVLPGQRLFIMELIAENAANIFAILGGMKDHP